MELPFITLKESAVAAECCDDPFLSISASDSLMMEWHCRAMLDRGLLIRKQDASSVDSLCVELSAFTDDDEQAG